MTKRRWWTLSALAAFAALLLVLVISFDWNWLKGLLENSVSAALERRFEVADLDIDLSTAPTITLEQVRIANAEWGSRPDMLTIQRVRFAIELWPLLRGKIRLPFLQVQAPDLLLETNQEGLANWKLGKQNESETPPIIPIIRNLEVANAAIRYHEPQRAEDIVAALESVGGVLGESSPGVQLNARGTVEQQPLALTLSAAPLAELEAEGERYPFRLDGRLGATHLRAEGSAIQPLKAEGLSVDIAFDSKDPGPLLALAGFEERKIGSLKLDLTLAARDQVWSVGQMDARLGGTDLSGSLAFDGRGEEPTIAAKLHSNQIHLGDLKGVLDVVRSGSRQSGGANRIEAALGDARAALEAQKEDAPGFDLSRATLPAIDAEVSYTIDRLSGPELNLQKVDFYGRLHDRLPHVLLSGDGRYQDEPVTLAVRVGEEVQGDRSYPIRIDLAAAGTALRAEGALARPAELDGLHLQFDLASRNPDQVLALAGMTRPQIPLFELHGQLAQDESSWQLSDLDGRLGQTDIHGRVMIDLDRPEPLVTADLTSDQVHLEDLEPFVPGKAEQAADAEPEAAVDAAIAEARSALEASEKGRGKRSGLSLDELAAIDVDLSYAVSSLTGPQLALSDLYASGSLEDGLPQLQLVGGGQYQGAPVEIDVQVGRAGAAASDPRAYPVDARIKAAATRIRVEGEIGKPKTFEALDLKIKVASEDINKVLALADVSLPRIPPFLISGHVVQDGQVWRLADFYGQFSDSELAGKIEVDLGDRRPFITADLRSKRLLVSDLAAAGGKAAVVEDKVAASAAGSKEGEVDAAKASGKHRDRASLISLEGINLDALPKVDADLSFQGQFVEYQELRFDQLSVDLKLRDQVAVLDASGNGQFRNGPLVLEAHAGTAESLKKPDAPYPIDLKLDSEETRVAVTGTVAKPGLSAGMDVDVALEGPDLDRLGEVLQLSLPTTPPFQLHSHLTRDESRWHLTDLNGTIGDSDIEGVATVVLGGERPRLEAKLTSKLLDFDDLGLLVGAPADTNAGETASETQKQEAAAEAAKPGVLPDKPFDVPELRGMDAKVAFEAERVQAPHLPLQGVTLDLTLEDGELRMEPLRFDLADGHLDSRIRLDGRTNILSGDIDLNIRRIRLDRLLSGFDIKLEGIELEQKGVGTLAGRAQLAVEGNSVKALAGSANGKAVVIMNGGQISSVAIEGMGLDVGEILALFTTEGEKAKSEMVPIRCFVGRFDIQDGIMQTEALVLDTTDSTITGKGQIDLGAETMNLELLAHPKDASALSASTPVRIEGTFRHPEINPVSEELEEKSLAALALGVVLPVVGALLPFVEEGETKDTDCGRLIADAAAAVPNSSPGKSN